MSSSMLKVKSDDACWTGTLGYIDRNGRGYDLALTFAYVHYR
jgi:hypothetical protein